MSVVNRIQEKACNCRNSKCMKLYCECFSARVQCNNNCRCLDCHNKGNNEILKIYRQSIPGLDRRSKDDFGKNIKGCACRKSNCMKKYCQCFQSGVSCTELCRCRQCQNNVVLNNRKVIDELKQTYSDNGSKQAFLYPIVISRNSQDLNSIISQSNPMNIQEQFIETSVNTLYEQSKQGEKHVLSSFLEILSMIDMQITQKVKIQAQEESQQCSQ